MPLEPCQQLGIETVNVAIEAKISITQPDALAVVAQVLGAKANESRRSDCVGNDRDRIKFKVLVCRGGRFEQSGNHIRHIRISSLGTKEQIAAIFQIAEIRPQRAAIGNGCADWFVFVCGVCQPDLPRPPEAHATIELIDSL